MHPMGPRDWMDVCSRVGDGLNTFSLPDFKEPFRTSACGRTPSRICLERTLAHELQTFYCVMPYPAWSIA